VGPPPVNNWGPTAHNTGATGSTTPQWAVTPGPVNVGWVMSHHQQNNNNRTTITTNQSPVTTNNNNTVLPPTMSLEQQMVTNNNNNSSLLHTTTVTGHSPHQSLGSPRSLACHWLNRVSLTHTGLNNTLGHSLGCTKGQKNNRASTTVVVQHTGSNCKYL